MTSSTAGRDLLIALKRSIPTAGPLLSIPVGAPPEALLRPVGTGDESMRDEDVVLLTEWRNRFVTAFLNEFECDVARTRRWLRDFVGPDQTRILFMLDSPAGGTFGYMGLAYIDWDRSYGEADAIVRGRDVRKGLMADAIQTLLGWARGQLHLREIGVRVLSDNPALDFYKRVGFREVKRVPLRRTTVGADIRWVEDEAAAASSRHLVHMRLF